MKIKLYSDKKNGDKYFDIGNTESLTKKPFLDKCKDSFIIIYTKIKCETISNGHDEACFFFAFEDEDSNTFYIHKKEYLNAKPCRDNYNIIKNILVKNIGIEMVYL